MEFIKAETKQTVFLNDIHVRSVHYQGNVLDVHVFLNDIHVRPVHYQGNLKDDL